MTEDDQARGGASLGVLSQMDPWEAAFIQNLRLWCDGHAGQMEVWDRFRAALPAEDAGRAMQDFERLVRDVCGSAHRNLVRHDISCHCVGADECIFLHLVRTASGGHLTDAALISSLLISPSQAERVALLAGAVGMQCRKITRGTARNPGAVQDRHLSGRMH